MLFCTSLRITQMGHYNAPVRQRDRHHADRGGGKGRRSSLQNLFSTKDAVTGKQYTGLCLDPADLCVAKLCAG